VQQRRLLLHVTLVPEREREQTPELPAAVLDPVDMVVDEPGDDGRIEETLAAQRLRRERRTRERLELAAQPGCSRDRETALAAVHDLAWQ
jgi:hypothetical protein